MRVLWQIGIRDDVLWRGHANRFSNRKIYFEGFFLSIASEAGQHHENGQQYHYRFSHVSFPAKHMVRSNQYMMKKTFFTVSSPFLDAIQVLAHLADNTKRGMGNP
jgi:hypothetical protein